THAPTPHPAPNETNHPSATQPSAHSLQVRLQHPRDLPARNLLLKGCQRLVGTSAGTSAERTRHKVLLVDGRQYLSGTSLERTVGYGGHAQRAHLRLPGLRGIHEQYFRSSISLTVNGLQHACDPFLKTLLRLRYGLPIHAGRGLGWNLRQIHPNPFLRDVMSKRRN